MQAPDVASKFVTDTNMNLVRFSWHGRSNGSAPGQAPLSTASVHKHAVRDDDHWSRSAGPQRYSALVHTFMLPMTDSLLFDTVIGRDTKPSHQGYNTLFCAIRSLPPFYFPTLRVLVQCNCKSELRCKLVAGCHKSKKNCRSM